MATIDSVFNCIGQQTYGAALLVTGDFNKDLTTLYGSNHGEEIAASIATSGMEDMSAQFLLYRKSWAQDRKTRCMPRLGREVGYQVD